MTGMRKLEGMPVMAEGGICGHVVRGVLSKDGKRLRGMVIRCRPGGTRWLKREQITLLGKVSVIAQGKGGRVPRDADWRLFRVSDMDGERIGIVTDAMIDEDTLRVTALEISCGPVDDLIRGRWYATQFSVIPGMHTGHVTVFTGGRG